MIGVISGLFITAFVSATLLPGSSEIALLGVLASGKLSAASAIGVATIGNSLGSCVNWALGRYAATWQSHHWFPVKQKQMEQYSRWYAKWGLWSLFASWAPIIGDPLTVMAGIARTPLWLFAMIVVIAKSIRYVVVAGFFTLF